MNIAFYLDEHEIKSMPIWTKTQVNYNEHTS